MYRFFLLLLLTFLTGCQKNITLHQPDWYLSLDNKRDDLIIGYGYGKTMQIAKANAREDISKILYVHIDSTLRIDENGLDSKLFERSMGNLYDVKVSKQEIKDENFFVALQYDIKPLVEQIVNSIDIREVVKMDENNPYLFTPFSKELSSIYGFVPKYNVIFSDGIYRVVLSKKYFTLKNQDIKKFQFQKNDKNIKISMQKIIKTGELYSVNIDIQNDGYLHLFQFQDDGKVSHLINNEYKIPQNILYPEPSKYAGIEAEILSNKNQENESYIAVLCSKETPINVFEAITDKFSSNDNGYRFTQLYPKIKECRYSSEVVKIIK